VYQSVLADVRLFELLGRIDQDLAGVVQGKGCGRCGGRLDRADYARKPRGMPVELGTEHAVRRSFCCAAEGCRRRNTPPSVRFLGRRVYVGAAIIGITALRAGARRDEARALRAWLKVRGSAPGVIFQSQQRRPISREMLHRLMKRYGAAAGIPEKLRHSHVLKHCCATHLLSKGFGVERVQDWIGHANIQSTMEYAKVTNARRDDMAQQLKETWR